MADFRNSEILRVEDSSADAEMTLHALRKNQLANRIRLVRDGEATLDFLFFRGAYVDRQADNAPLVLLDLKLPKVNRLELLQEIKSDSRKRSIPVTVRTSSKERRNHVKSYTLGVGNHIEKLASLAGFQKVVRQLGMCRLLINGEPLPAAFTAV
ncbi:MAG: response regulator [Candidatus Acidiferrales bacterium]